MLQFGHDVDRGMAIGGARVMLLGAMRGGKGPGMGADIRQILEGTSVHGKITGRERTWHVCGRAAAPR